MKNSNNCLMIAITTLALGYGAVITQAANAWAAPSKIEGFHRNRCIEISKSNNFSDRQTIQLCKATTAYTYSCILDSLTKKLFPSFIVKACASANEYTTSCILTSKRLLMPGRYIAEVCSFATKYVNTCIATGLHYLSSFYVSETCAGANRATARCIETARQNNMSPRATREICKREAWTITIEHRKVL